MHLRELIGQAPTRDLGWLIRDALPATSALDASPDPIPTGVPVAVRSQKRLEALRGIDSRERWAKQHAYPIALPIGSAHACGVVGLRTLKSNMFVSGQTPHTAIRVVPATSRGVKLHGAFEAPAAKTLGAELERNRLEHRAGRIELVLATLGGRGSYHRIKRGIPLRGFDVRGDLEAEVATINLRLRGLKAETDQFEPETPDESAY